MLVGRGTESGEEWLKCWWVGVYIRGKVGKVLVGRGIESGEGWVKCWWVQNRG